MTQAITHKSLNASLYETDFLLWTEETVAKLKARDFDHVDLENLKDEYEKKGYHIPEQWQFSRDIDAMLSVKFWDE